LRLTTSIKRYDDDELIQYVFGSNYPLKVFLQRNLGTEPT